MAIQLYNTPTVEGKKILAYKGFVNASQVTSAGFLTDFLASFSDFFGGNSGVYRSKLNDLCSDVLEQLDRAATAKGANAIIALHIDFDEVSVKDVSMFMVSAQGTAVILEEERDEKIVTNTDFVTSRQLKREVFHYNIKPKISGAKISESDWKTLVSYAEPSIAEDLHNEYLVSLTKRHESYYREYFVEYFEKYFARLPFEKQIDLVYVSDKELDTIVNFELFDAKKILAKAKEGKLDFAISCLSADRKIYSKSDIVDMEELYSYLTNLPDVGQIADVKGGIFSSAGKKFICVCGNKNDIDATYCSGCGKNIKGLTYGQVAQIDLLRVKIEFLKNTLS